MKFVLLYSNGILNPSADLIKLSKLIKISLAKGNTSAANVLMAAQFLEAMKEISICQSASSLQLLTVLHKLSYQLLSSEFFRVQLLYPTAGNLIPPFPKKDIFTIPWIIPSSLFREVEPIHTTLRFVGMLLSTHYLDLEQRVVRVILCRILHTAQISRHKFLKSLHLTGSVWLLELLHLPQHTPYY